MTLQDEYQMEAIPFEIAAKSKSDAIARAAEPMEMMVDLDQHHEDVQQLQNSQTLDSHEHIDGPKLESFKCYWDNCNTDCGNFRELVLHVGGHIDANDWTDEYLFIIVLKEILVNGNIVGTSISSRVKREWSNMSVYILWRSPLL